MSNLELSLLFLFAAVIGVVAFRVLHLPPMLGYLVVGAAIGPNALHLAPDLESTRDLAEFGVVFLMFSIGLEFSLPKLYAMKRIVFGFGFAQVASTILLAVVGGWALTRWMPRPFGTPGGAALLALGGALAMSSTAIVVKMLTERIELESEHGRRIVGVLLFQDLAVIPLLIVVPALAAPDGELVRTLVVALVKAAVVLALLLYFGQKLMRQWFTVVARRRSQELFMLNLLLVTLGLAWITELAGLSLALGAFVAGMLISETEYRHRVEEDIKPFRDVLLGLFFITIGMLLNVGVVASHLGWVLVLFVGPLTLKLLLITGLARLFGASPGVAIRTGLGLAQAGEFGFVLLNLAGELRLLDPLLLQIVLAAMLLSMLTAPFLIQYSDRIAMRIASSEWMLQSLALTQIASRAMATRGHVIVCGFGRSGQNLVRLLDQESIAYVALDLDPDRVRDAQAGGDAVVYGDATRRESLTAAGIQRAAALVVTYAETQRGREDAAPRARARAAPAGHRPHARRRRPRPVARGRRDRGRAGDRRRQPDARVARARAARRAGRARRGAHLGRARLAIPDAVGLLPRRRRSRRRPDRPVARPPAFGDGPRSEPGGRPLARRDRHGPTRRRRDRDPATRHPRRRPRARRAPDGRRRRRAARLGRGARARGGAPVRHDARALTRARNRSTADSRASRPREHDRYTPGAARHSARPLRGHSSRSSPSSR